MADIIRMNRKAKIREDGKIVVTTDHDESMTIDEFNDQLINAYNDKEKLRVELEIMKAKINRLKVEETPELKEFAEKLKKIEQIRELNATIETAKKWEKLINTLEKDLIHLRTIQEELKLIKGGKR